MYRIMLVSESTTEYTLVKLGGQYSPEKVIKSTTGPADLAQGRWEKIEAGMTEALVGVSISAELEVILVGQIGTTDCGPVQNEEAHKRIVDATTDELKVAKGFVIDLILHKIALPIKNIHPVLIIMDYVRHETIKVEDLEA